MDIYVHVQRSIILAEEEFLRKKKRSNQKKMKFVSATFGTIVADDRTLQRTFIGWQYDSCSVQCPSLMVFRLLYSDMEQNEEYRTVGEPKKNEILNFFLLQHN